MKRHLLYIISMFFPSLSSESAHHETPVALGKYQSLPCSIGITKATCILCQEEQEISHNSRAMVLAGFVQR